MQALVTTLPKPYEDQVLALWDELEAKFGLKYVRMTPIPHFTWHLGETYQLEKVESILDRLSAGIQPFEVSVRGAESFISHAPVVFLKIHQDPNLLRLHSAIWQSLLPYTTEPEQLYNSAMWQPHITLALQDLDWDALGSVLDFLATQDLNWRFLADHFSILSKEPDQGIVLLHHFQFGKGQIY